MNKRILMAIALVASLLNIKAGMLDSSLLWLEKAEAINPDMSTATYAEILASAGSKGFSVVAGAVGNFPALFVSPHETVAPVVEAAASVVPVPVDSIVPSAAESSAIFSGIDTPTVVGVIAVLGIAFTYKHLSDAGYDVKGPSALIYDYLKASYNRVTGATALAEKAAKAARFAEADALVTAHETAQWNADIQAVAAAQAESGIVSRLTLFANNHRYGLAGAALACAGLGAYYGYKYYQNASSASTHENEVE